MLFKQKVYNKIALQTGDTYSRMEIIHNLYINNLLDLKKNHKDEFQLSITHLQLMLYNIKLY